jgi:hypothetical protein
MADSKYQVGQYVKVYFDPLTERDFEGDAKLVQHVNEVGEHDGRTVHMWKVRFRGESSTYSRLVKEPAETQEVT